MFFSELNACRCKAHGEKAESTDVYAAFCPPPDDGENFMDVLMDHRATDVMRERKEGHGVLHTPLP